MESALLNVLVSILRRVFHREEDASIARLQQHKRAITTFFALVLLAVLTWLYLNFIPLRLQATLTQILLTPSPIWVSVLLFAFLVIFALFYYGHLRDSSYSQRREFADEFRNGLLHWDYYGDWRVARDGSQPSLIVTNSDAGSIVKHCLTWTDYEFQFDTKIARDNTSWIIRASDILNYMMLQCGSTELVPHFRSRGFWFRLQPIQLSVTVPKNVWFGVRIRVSGVRVVVVLRIDDKDIEVLDSPLLAPQSAIADVKIGDISRSIDLVLSLPMGSVGFREWGWECAHFRNVRVKRI